jgi:hypothetical protein
VKAILVAALAIAIATEPAMAHDPWAPSQVRDRMIGCWKVATDQQLVITAFGKHSVNSRLEGAKRTRDALARWRPSDAAFELACGLVTSDGLCLVSPDGDKLHVRLRPIANPKSRSISELDLERCIK